MARVRWAAIVMVAASVTACGKGRPAAQGQGSASVVAPAADAAAKVAHVDATPSVAPVADPAVVTAVDGGAAAVAIPAAAAADDALAGRVTAEYRGLRRLLAAVDDADDEPTAAETAALAKLLGKRGVAQVAGEAEAIGWPRAVRHAWLDRLVAAAATGAASTVRIPLSFCVGYGCEIPSEWVAAGCFEQDAFFVIPTGATKLMDAASDCYRLPDDKIDACKEARGTLTVEGHFTGKTVKPEHCELVGHEFVVERARVGGERAPSLRLPAGAPAVDGPAITDGPRWGVLWASAFMTEPGATATAEAMVARMEKAGVTGAEVVDSRRVSTLWCCSAAVIAGRYDAREAATAAAAKLGKQGFRDLIVRELY